MEAIRSNGTKYDCLLFDMDDTLYPLSLGINMACRKNIEEYMLHHLKIEESEVPRMCLELYKEHGTTMAGLKSLGYEFDNDEFHAYVHGRLPYELLKPDPVLHEAHVGQVLSRMGLEDCFQGVICFETLNPRVENFKPINGLDEECINEVEKQPQEDIETKKNDDSGLKTQILCKPSVEAMEAAIRIANVDPKKTIFFDDSVRNIANGKAAGLHTVIVGRSTLVPGADHALNSIHNIREALPEIWEDEGEHLEQIIQSSAVETVVLA
ncbi:hypothetical protein DH2020_011883 [Rehmannia glutinosa]|uniref:Haloacid dehalogenase-like hydrolase (HAD) superfamily protein n=1 Tax=Rehmannia glutinosa TaxID=99300 RepID=A0ABR0XEK0_REHGL